MSARNRKKPKRVEVYLTESENEILEQMCTESGYSKTEYFRQLLKREGDQFFRGRIEENIKKSSLGFVAA